MRHGRAFRRSQRGFTLIELGVVAVISVVLVALAVPKIADYIIAGRVPAAGRDLIKAITRLQQLSTISQSATPYSILLPNEKIFVDSNFTITGSTVKHGLGASNGEVYLTTLLAGTAFAITAWGLDSAACPNLASIVSKAATSIEVSTSGTAALPTAPAAPTAIPTSISPTVVKTATSSYDASSANAACTASGQFNYMRFYITK